MFEDGVCVVDVEGVSGGLFFYGILKGVGIVVFEILVCGL